MHTLTQEDMKFFVQDDMDAVTLDLSGFDIEPDVIVTYRNHKLEYKGVPDQSGAVFEFTGPDYKLSVVGKHSFRDGFGELLKSPFQYGVSTIRILEGAEFTSVSDMNRALVTLMACYKVFSDKDERSESMRVNPEFRNGITINMMHGIQHLVGPNARRQLPDLKWCAIA